MVAQEENDFKTAQEWYLKSLIIEKKQCNPHGIAQTLGQLGVLTGLAGEMEACAEYLNQCIAIFFKTNDQRSTELAKQHILLFHGEASTDNQQKMESIWQEAGLGPLPKPS
jgi:hypothetical protein